MGASPVATGGLVAASVPKHCIAIFAPLHLGCGNGIEVGGRPNGWLHIAANGDTFICCNDYDFETVFGNTNDKPISDIWMSMEHKNMTVKSFENFCRTCVHAIWGD